MKSFALLLTLALLPSAAHAQRASTATFDRVRFESKLREKLQPAVVASKGDQLVDFARLPKDRLKQAIGDALKHALANFQIEGDTNARVEAILDGTVNDLSTEMFNRFQFRIPAAEGVDPLRVSRDLLLRKTKEFLAKHFEEQYPSLSAANIQEFDVTDLGSSATDLAI